MRHALRPGTRARQGATRPTGVSGAGSLAARVRSLLGGDLAALYLPGPGWWFTDAGKGSPAGDTDPIRVWADASGNGRDLTQATTASRPQARLVGGRWRAVFDGVDDWVQADGFARSGGVGVVQAACNTSAANGQRAWWAGGAVSDYLSAYLSFSAYRFAGTGALNLDAGWGYESGVFRTRALTYDGVTARTYRDGVAGPTATPTTAVGSPTVLTVGGNAGGGEHWGGDVAAHVVASRELSAADVSALTALLAGVLP